MAEGAIIQQGVSVHLAACPSADQPPSHPINNSNNNSGWVKGSLSGWLLVGCRSRGPTLHTSTIPFRAGRGKGRRIDTRCNGLELEGRGISPQWLCACV